VRVKAVSVFLSVNWSSNLLIGLFTLTSIDALGGVASGQSDDEVGREEKRGVAYLYLIFASVVASTLAFLFFYVPETKGTLYSTPFFMNHI
jgi:hypothetical protein